MMGFNASAVSSSTALFFVMLIRWEARNAGQTNVDGVAQAFPCTSVQCGVSNMFHGWMGSTGAWEGLGDGCIDGDVRYRFLFLPRHHPLGISIPRGWRSGQTCHGYPSMMEAQRCLCLFFFFFTRLGFAPPSRVVSKPGQKTQRRLTTLVPRRQPPLPPPTACCLLIGPMLRGV